MEKSELNIAETKERLMIQYEQLQDLVIETRKRNKETRESNQNLKNYIKEAKAIKMLNKILMLIIGIFIFCIY